MTEDQTYYVYTLVDPILKVPFYIGKGKGDRAYSHLKGWDKNNKAKVAYIERLREQGVEPYVSFIETGISEWEALYSEQLYIDLAIKEYNLPITNNTPRYRKPHRRPDVAERNRKLKSVIIDKDRLTDLYLHEGMGYGRIAKVLGVSKSLVRTQIEKLGLKELITLNKTEFFGQGE